MYIDPEGKIEELTILASNLEKERNAAVRLYGSAEKELDDLRNGLVAILGLTHDKLAFPDKVDDSVILKTAKGMSHEVDALQDALEAAEAERDVLRNELSLVQSLVLAPLRMTAEEIDQMIDQEAAKAGITPNDEERQEAMEKFANFAARIAGYLSAAGINIETDDTAAIIAVIFEAYEQERQGMKAALRECEAENANWLTSAIERAHDDEAAGKLMPIYSLLTDEGWQGWRPVTEDWPRPEKNRLYWVAQSVGRNWYVRVVGFDGDWFDADDHVYLADDSVKYAVRLPMMGAFPDAAEGEG